MNKWEVLFVALLAILASTFISPYLGAILNRTSIPDPRLEAIKCEHKAISSSLLQLPKPQFVPSPFINRSTYHTQLRSFLNQQPERYVVLLGPGGSGKSTAVKQALQSFPGAFFFYLVTNIASLVVSGTYFISVDENPFDIYKSLLEAMGVVNYEVSRSDQLAHLIRSANSSVVPTFISILTARHCSTPSLPLSKD